MSDTEGIEAGIVGIDTGMISTEITPFGGVKLSGLAAKARRSVSRIISRSNICAWDYRTRAPGPLSLPCRNVATVAGTVLSGA